jgi:tRNA (guanine37-N1)-methyltransferase
VRVDVMTLFPAMFEGFLAHGLVRIARDKGLLDVRLRDFREFATDKHKSVDDRPYGGGPGMVLMCGPIYDCDAAVAAEGQAAGLGAPRRVMLTPTGRRLDQALLGELAREPWLVILCGHYEGFDERVRLGLQPLEVSLGDFVLSGGELPAMVLIDGVARLIPGVVGDPAGPHDDSFSGTHEGLLEGPQYTRPRVFRDMEVPEVLLSGDHGAIAAWRREQALARTRERRPDLLAAAATKREQELER